MPTDLRTLNARVFSICFFLFLATFSILPSAVVFGQEKEQSAADQNVKPDKTAKQEAPVREFFGDYQKATNADSLDDLIELYDFDQMCRDILTRAEVDLPIPIQFMSKQISARVKSQMELVDQSWERYIVPKILFFDETHCEAYVRSWDTEGTSSRHNFWLHRVGEKWLIHDYTELSVGLNFTELGAMGMRQGAKGNVTPESRKAMQAIMQGMAAIAQEDVEAGTEAIAETFGKPMPSFMESIRWLLYASVNLDYDPRMSLEYINKASAIQGELPVANYLRSVASNEIGRPKLAAKYAKLFLKRFGNDPDALYELAAAQREMGQDAQALASTRLALDDTPNSVLNLLTLGELLPEQDVQELVTRMAKLKDISNGFQALADWLETHRKGRALEAVVAYMQEHHPEEDYLGYYDSVAKNLAGDSKGAIAELLGQISQLDPEEDEFSYCQYLLYEIYVENPELIKTQYTASKDRKKFFVDMVGQLIDFDEIADAVDVLFKMHFAEFEDDSTSHYQAASLLVATDDYQRALRHLKKVDASKVDPDLYDDDLEEMSSLAMYELGKHMQAIRESKTPWVTANRMLEMAWDEDEIEKAKAILAYAKKELPENIRHSVWDAQIAFAEERYEDALKLSGQVLLGDSKRSGDQVAKGDRSGYNAMPVVHQAIRSALRLKKYDRAIELAKLVVDDEDRFWVTAVSLACLGDRDRYEKHARTARVENALEGISDDIDFPLDFLDSDDADEEHLDGRLRRVEMLVRRPITLDADAVAETLEKALQRRLTIDKYHDTSLFQTNFVSQLSLNACIVNVDGMQFFVQGLAETVSGDKDLFVEEHDFELTPQLTEAIQSHTALLTVDVMAWPTEDDKEPAYSYGLFTVPIKAQRLVASIATAIAEPAGIQAVHESDSSVVGKWNPDFKKRFLGDNPHDQFMEIERESPSNDE